MSIRKIALCALAVVAACTPEQLAQVEKFHGVDFSATEEANLLALPDNDYVAGRTTIHPDGSITETPCEEPAAPEAHFIMDGSAAMQSFRSVACYRGWPAERIAAWEPFMYDVVIKESMGCFNLRRNPILRVVLSEGVTRPARWGDGCVEALAANRNTEDAGYGQVTRSGWGPRGVVCRTTGLCSAEQIVASPWNSMLATVVFVEANGSQPWCYNARARRFHNCSLAPDR